MAKRIKLKKRTRRSTASDKPNNGRRRCQDWLKDHSFKKGQSGNPEGRPKGAKNSIRAAMKIALNSVGVDRAIRRLKRKGYDIGEASTNAEIIAMIMVHKTTVMHELDAIKEYMKQTEKPLGAEYDPDADQPIKVTMNLVRSRK